MAISDMNESLVTAILGAVTGVRRETPPREQPLRRVGAKLAGGKLSRGKFVAQITLKVYSKCTLDTL